MRLRAFDRSRRHGRGWAGPLIPAIALLFSAPAAPVVGDDALAFRRTEERATCDHYDPLRRPFFGDLHVHTSYSFDSYISSQRNDPWDAYRYAKGEPIAIANEDGEQTVVAQLRRPLDFTAVSDHGEFLGEMNICTGDRWSFGYFMPLCLMSRSDIYIVQLLAAGWWTGLGVTDTSAEKERAFLCDLPGEDCEARLSEFWTNIQRAAEDHYDRSSQCSFTTFVAYEYTDAPEYKNLHRNVIFRNQRVTRLPISTYDTGSRNVPELWRRLREECIDGSEGCDVLAIPHNPNLSSGLMFPDPASLEEAQQRSFFETVVELMQHKAGSECRYDRLLGRGLDTEDELCTFEQNKTDNLSSLGVLYGELRTETGRPVPLDEFGRRNMMRNVLKDGLALEQKMGVNPFKLGFIGSTDTHSATPGATEEDNYTGHLGRRDSGYRNVQDHFEDNPGGLAVVWAEENSRDSIFEAIRRRETYATSGTRPIVRVFGGWGFEQSLCGSQDLVARAYREGVPMGGDLPPAPEAARPRFAVAVLKDPGSPAHPGRDLQRLQMIKGWVDAQGETHEAVFEIAGDAGNGATVDRETCEPVGNGYSDLCAVWEDESFDPEHPAFYYVRVLENPSCRWSTLQCQAAGVNPFAADCKERAQERTAMLQDERGARGDVYGRCCLAPEEEPFYEPVIQERAWTSPIWYRPAGGETP